MDPAAAQTLEVSTIAITLIGGMALFLYGLKIITIALKKAAGNKLKNLLAKMTTNRFTGMFAGAIVTIAFQSSTVTTVLMVGFISAGLLTSLQSVSVIIGANIGTTITAQIIAFNISQYSLVLIVLGFLIEFLSKKYTLRQYGTLILGLGFIFFGMQLMVDATRPLRAYQPFIELMYNLQNPMMSILIGTVFTALIHSSAATAGIIIVLSSQGLISLEAGIALVLGSNIGTCFTAVTAAIGKPREAVKAAVIHIAFNVLGVLIWLPFLGQFSELVRFISMDSEAVTSLSRAPRQIANAHTLFNVINAFIFIWFTVPLARLVDIVVPKSKKSKTNVVEPKFLQKIFLKQPDLALDQVRLEIHELGKLVLPMIRESLPALTSGNYEGIKRLKSMDDNADKLYEAIVNYLRTLSAEALTVGQTKKVYYYLAMTNIFENIGDAIETNLVSEAMGRLKSDVHVSPGTLNYLQSLHKMLCHVGELSVEAIQTFSLEKAAEAAATKQEFNNLLKEARKHLAFRLCKNEPGRLEAYKLETDIMETFKYIHTLIRRIAKLINDISALDKVSAFYS